MPKTLSKDFVKKWLRWAEKELGYPGLRHVNNLQPTAELRPLEQRYTRRLADLKGSADARMDEYRWLLEELRVSFFAQELRTPQPVSVKRLQKVWEQLQS